MTKLRRKSAISSEDPELIGPPPSDARGEEELLGPPASDSASIKVIVAGTGREAIRRRLEPFQTQQIRLGHHGEIGKGAQLCGARRARVETRAARTLATQQRCQRQSAQQTEIRPARQGR